MISPSMTDPRIFNGSFELSSVDSEGKESTIPYLDLKVQGSVVFKTECLFRGLSSVPVPVIAKYHGSKQKVYISEKALTAYEAIVRQILPPQSPSSVEISEPSDSPVTFLEEEVSKIIDPRNFRSAFELITNPADGKSYLSLEENLCLPEFTFKIPYSSEKTSEFPHEITFSQNGFSTTVYISTRDKIAYNTLALDLTNKCEERHLAISSKSAISSTVEEIDVRDIGADLETHFKIQKHMASTSIDEKSQFVANDILFQPFIACRAKIEESKMMAKIQKKPLHPGCQSFYRNLFKLNP